MHQTIILVAKLGILVPIIAYVLLAHSQRANLKQLIIFTALAAITTLVLIKIASLVHSDPRPFVRDGVTPYFIGAKDNGFPSDHTGFSAFIAAVVFRYKKQAGFILFLIAILIGISRVIAGVHHGQDVVAALLIAVTGVFVSHLLINQWSKQTKHTLDT